MWQFLWTSSWSVYSFSYVLLNVSLKHEISCVVWKSKITIWAVWQSISLDACVISCPTSSHNPTMKTIIGKLSNDLTGKIQQCQPRVRCLDILTTNATIVFKRVEMKLVICSAVRLNSEVLEYNFCRAVNKIHWIAPTVLQQIMRFARRD